MSVDVARYGVDSTVIGLRDGMKVHPFRKYERQSLEKTADIVYDTVISEQPDLIIIDESGIGASVLDNLLSSRRTATRNRTVGFNGARKPDKEEEFYNRRAEVYWYLREQFQKGLIDIPDDEALGPQLTEMGYQYKSLRGHTVMIIESKEEARRAGKPSPDEADALSMLFADEVSNQPGYGVWV
jgi:hypothetical protein